MGAPKCELAEGRCLGAMCIWSWKTRCLVAIWEGESGELPSVFTTPGSVFTPPRRAQATTIGVETTPISEGFEELDCVNDLCAHGWPSTKGRRDAFVRTVDGGERRQVRWGAGFEAGIFFLGGPAFEGTVRAGGAFGIFCLRGERERGRGIAAGSAVKWLNG
jgi:hypothetical protein